MIPHPGPDAAHTSPFPQTQFGDLKTPISKKIKFSPSDTPKTRPHLPESKQFSSTAQVQPK